MISSHGRSSSHAPSRPLSSRPPSSRQRDEPLLSAQTAEEARKRRREEDYGGLSEAGANKRRRLEDGGAVAAEELLKPSIVVRAHPPNPLTRPCTLLPLMLLPREHLPLSCLDLAAPHGGLPSSRQFQSHIRILELEGRLGSNVLLARLPSSNGNGSGSGSGFSSVSSTFALERDAAGFYVLCKLGSWADIRKLSQFATAVCHQRMPAPARSAASTAEPALLTPQVYKEQGRKRLAIAELQSIVRRRPASQLVADPPADPAHLPGLSESAPPEPEPAAGAAPPETNVDGLPAQLPSQTWAQDKLAVAAENAAVLPTPPASDATKVSPPPPPSTEAPEPPGPPAADDIFENIRNQYFEALYHSLGSLAYFAKGPLSRARAAFHLDCDSSLDMDDLIGYLKGLVLTAPLIDKKYRETIPEMVARLRTFGDLSDHAEPKRRTKKKKVKLGSNGLYSDEEAHVCRWWEANKPAPRDDEVLPRPDEVRYTISCLRTRETQLQMILILEILALETMRPAGDATESQLPGMPAEAATAVQAAKKDPPKKRNKHNLPLLIDVHADRLCIWQSTVSDDVRALAESQVRPSGDHGQAFHSAHSDPLKEFCVDIILPFFSPRLPLVCDSLNRKLGGPVIAPLPSKSRATASTSRSPSDAKGREKQQQQQQQRAKPGAATRRTSAATSSARSLERVLSSERLRRSVSRGPNDAIAQMRSATAAPIPGLKREMSEPASLAAIPRRASSTSLRDRDRPTKTLARSMSDAVVGSGSGNSTQRRPDDPRAQKKALVEAELQEAISALKKPNRGLAGKAAVEAAERRLFGGASGHARKPKKPTRPAAPSPGDRVQVKATPLNSRFRDVYATTTTTMHVGGRAEDQGGGQASYSQHYEDHRYSAQPTNRALLFPARGSSSSSGRPDGVLDASPRVAATPVAGRIQATPVRRSTAVPDSAVRLTATASVTMTATATAAEAATSTTTMVTATTTSTAFQSRPSVLYSFPEDEEESVPLSSPVAARRAAPMAAQPPHGSRDGLFRRRMEETEAFVDYDMVPASSPLQARSQPAAASGAPTAPLSVLRTQQQQNNASMAVADGSSRRDAALFATPTKVRPGMGKGDEAEAAALSTPARAPALAPVGGGNSVQSLYQQMGWDDELDDFA